MRTDELFVPALVLDCAARAFGSRVASVRVLSIDRQRDDEELRIVAAARLRPDLARVRITIET